MSSSCGRIFRVATWGESHGVGLGCAIEGCPPGLHLSTEEVQSALDRRRPGQSTLTTPRAELDRVEIVSGVFEGRTLGTPIGMLFRNHDVDSSHYEELNECFRPGHADYTYWGKYGHRDWRGGGRASARETVARVAAGAVAEKLLKVLAGVEIIAWVDSVGEFAADVDGETVLRSTVSSSSLRCPDVRVAAAMEEHIREARRGKDSVGGCIRCVARNVPVGWGEPVFGKLTAELARGMLSIPAARGFEIGEGFSSTKMSGSEHNDQLESRPEGIRMRTNHSGGIQGGISNGETIWFRVAFKPISTISIEQDSVDVDGNPLKLELTGRHDSCVLPRAVPIVEAMCALTLVDAALVQAASRLDLLG